MGLLTHLNKEKVHQSTIENESRAFCNRLLVKFKRSYLSLNMDGEQISEQNNEVVVEETFDLVFDVPDEMPTLYVNEMAIQEINTEFILTFFEVRLPIVPDKTLRLEASKSLKPKCVARVVVPAERIPSIISALDKRFKAFMKQRLALTKKTVKAEE